MVDVLFFVWLTFMFLLFCRIFVARKALRKVLKTYKEGTISF